MFRRFLCWIGQHEWACALYSLKHGGRFGDRCIHCGRWADDAAFFFANPDKEQTSNGR